MLNNIANSAFFVDGLLVRDQPVPLESPEQANYAHDCEHIADLHEAVKTIKPDALIGLSCDTSIKRHSFACTSLKQPGMEIVYFVMQA